MTSPSCTTGSSAIPAVGLRPASGNVEPAPAVVPAANSATATSPATASSEVLHCNDFQLIAPPFSVTLCSGGPSITTPLRADRQEPARPRSRLVRHGGVVVAGRGRVALAGDEDARSVRADGLGVGVVVAAAGRPRVARP